MGAPSVAAQIFSRSVREGFNTICFTQSRKLTELIHVWSLRMVPELKRYISSYRPGFLPEERREIERAMAAARCAGDLHQRPGDGYRHRRPGRLRPGGLPRHHGHHPQRAGRVGRQGRDSLIVLVAQADALDQYFIKFPDEFFGRPLETAVIDPDNPTWSGRICPARPRSCRCKSRRELFRPGGL